ncbi:recombinase family protein [Mesorhizobium sp.]|uniref:recombinase family protein n=1 Tax=Mesorhizobium sp. TaxID=1871066 RepID=UPI00345B2D7D
MSLIRSGIQSLIADAQAGRFDMVLSEALDRLSRDQEDVAGVYKRLRFAGVTISPCPKARATNFMSASRAP